MCPITDRNRHLFRQPDATADEIRNVALIHIRASGPVSFRSIVAYCREQCVGGVDNSLVAAVLTGLIRLGDVELYDDGVTFNPCH